MRHRRSFWIAAAVLCCAALAAVLAADGSGPADASPAGRSDASALPGRSFVSTEVIRGGEPRDLVSGTRLRVSFTASGGNRSIGWHAGCNHFSGEVRITHRRLIVGTIIATEIGCSGGLPKQDAFFSRFFGSDPRWHLRGRRLTLRSKRTLIRLRRDPAHHAASP